jgi:hypothetical protein
MAISPSSSVRQARQELAARLREIRLDPGLIAWALSAVGRLAAGHRAARRAKPVVPGPGDSLPRSPGHYPVPRPRPGAVQGQGPELAILAGMVQRAVDQDAGLTAVDGGLA